VQITPALRSRSAPAVFAAGDCAAFEPPLAKSGVRAVRMAPVLAHNLRAALLGQPLQPHVPQRDTLALLAVPGHGAIASRGRWLALQGRCVGRLKDRLDQRFMQQFSAAALFPTDPRPSPP
ncbi:MAG: selenide, water dikinase SelD, partial [Roseateles sp.]